MVPIEVVIMTIYVLSCYEPLTAYFRVTEDTIELEKPTAINHSKQAHALFLNIILFPEAFYSQTYRNYYVKDAYYS